MAEPIVVVIVVSGKDPSTDPPVPVARAVIVQVVVPVEVIPLSMTVIVAGLFYVADVRAALSKEIETFRFGLVAARDTTIFVTPPLVYAMIVC